MLKKHLLVILVFLFGVLGCASWETVESTKVAPSEIYQSYSVRSSKNSTSVNATFRVGGSTGSTVDLDAPSSISHNGNEMKESAPGFMKGTDYYTSTNEFVPNHNFVFKDASGKVWTNEISLESLEITAQNITISKANGGTITLSRPIGKDENVEFSLVSEKTAPPSDNSNSSNKKAELDHSTNLQFSLDATRNSIKIEQFSLKNFVDGKANLKITVRKNKPAQQSAKGGALDFVYESQKVAVNVVN